MSGRCILLNPLRRLIINDNPLARVHLVLLGQHLILTPFFIIETVAIFLRWKLMSLDGVILFRGLLRLFLNWRWKFWVILMKIR